MEVPVIFIKDEHEEGNLYWRLDDADAPKSFFNYVRGNIRGDFEIEVDFITKTRWEEIERATKELNGEI